MTKRKSFVSSPFILLSCFLLALFLSIHGITLLSEKTSPQGCVSDAGILFSDSTQTADMQFGEFEGHTVLAPSPSFLAQEEEESDILGEETATNKRIEINLSQQRVLAYEGDTLVFNFLVSTGKWALTPTGRFTIQKKVRSQTMSGGSKAKNTYYYLPGVPWVMFFGNSQIPWSRGFSFHGAYWHNNFGQRMSHGCINMKIPESEQLYQWAPIGTPVIIYN